ncbi:MAG TPA: hypothetical protein VGB78_07675 [Thermoplasmata archaeon]
MRVVQVKCPSCNSPIYEKELDRVFFCDKCNVLHVRNGGIEKLDYEIGDFGPSAQGEKVYMPFWRVYATFVIHSKNVEGGSMFKLASWLRGATDTGNMFIYVPAGDLDPGSFKNLAMRFTTSNPRYPTKLSFGGVKRLPVAVTKAEAAELADFVVVSIEAEQPGMLQQLNYTLTINDTKMVYLPFVKSAGGLVPGL